MALEKQEVKICAHFCENFDRIVNLSVRSDKRTDGQHVYDPENYNSQDFYDYNDFDESMLFDDSLPYEGYTDPAIDQIQRGKRSVENCPIVKSLRALKNCPNFRNNGQTKFLNRKMLL